MNALKAYLLLTMTIVAHSKKKPPFQVNGVSTKTSASTTRTAAVTGSVSTLRRRQRLRSSASAKRASSGLVVLKVSLMFHLMANHLHCAILRVGNF